MIVTVFEFVYCSTIDGNLEVRTKLFPTYEEAKKYFDESVENDIKDLTESAECRGHMVLRLKAEHFDELVEDGDYVIDYEEAYYESYQYGSALDSTVFMKIKEHSLEVK